MKKLEKMRFKEAIRLTTGTPFQIFICELYEKIHGVDNFIRLRTTKDDGADGIITKTLKVMACYGPNSYDKKDFEKKVKDDYQKFKTNWKKQYPEWLFIFNQELSPDAIRTFQKKKDSEILGVDQILLLVGDLNCFQRKNLGVGIGIDKELLDISIIQDLIEKLAENFKDEKIEYTKPNYIQDKIQKNFSPQEVLDANFDYQEALQIFPLIKNVLSESTDYAYLANFKAVIRSDFDSTTGTFKLRINQLIDRYKAKYGGDDCAYYVKALIFYCFEQCFIGKKVDGEK
jgi:hypothetical protein